MLVLVPRVKLNLSTLILPLIFPPFSLGVCVCRMCVCVYGRTGAFNFSRSFDVEKNVHGLQSKCAFMDNNFELA